MMRKGREVLEVEQRCASCGDCFTAIEETDVCAECES